MDGRKEESIKGWMKGWMEESIKGWMKGRMEERKKVLKNELRDGWKSMFLPNFP